MRPVYCSSGWSPLYRHAWPKAMLQCFMLQCFMPQCFTFIDRLARLNPVGAGWVWTGCTLRGETIFFCFFAFCLPTRMRGGFASL